jgi:hypothetical protein
VRSSEKVVSRSAGAQRQSFNGDFQAQQREATAAAHLGAGGGVFWEEQVCTGVRGAVGSRAGVGQEAAAAAAEVLMRVADVTDAARQQRQRRRPPLAGTVHERDLQTRLT